MIPIIFPYSFRTRLSWEDALKEIASWKKQGFEKFKDTDIPNTYGIFILREVAFQDIALRLVLKYDIVIKFKWFYKEDDHFIEETKSIYIVPDSLPKSIKEKIDGIDESDDTIEVDITDEVDNEVKRKWEQEWFAKSKDWKDAWQDFSEVRKDALKRFKNSNIDKHYRFIAERQDYSKSIEISYSYYYKEKDEWFGSVVISRFIFVDSLPKNIKEKIDAQSGKSVDITDEMNLALASKENDDNEKIV